MRSDLPVAGFAVELVSGTPCALAQGVVEVWPLDPMP